jgi:hypothetical protein
MSTIKELIIHFFTLSPGKRARVVMYLFQVLFSVIFASKLYEYFIGSYDIINITDYKKIMDFFSSGRFIVCFFFVLASWVVFYNIGFQLIKWGNRKLVHIILNTIWKWVKNKSGEKDDDIERKLTKKIENYLEQKNAIEITEDNKKLKGKNFSEYKNMVDKMKNNSSDKHHLLPYLLLTLLFQFNIVYFLSFDDEVNSFFLDFIISGIFIFYLFSFFLNMFIQESLVKLMEFVDRSFVE